MSEISVTLSTQADINQTFKNAVLSFQEEIRTVRPLFETIDFAQSLSSPRKFGLKYSINISCAHCHKLLTYIL